MAIRQSPLRLSPVTARRPAGAVRNSLWFPCFASAAAERMERETERSRWRDHVVVRDAESCAPAAVELLVPFRRAASATVGSGHGKDPSGSGFHRPHRNLGLRGPLIGVGAAKRTCQRGTGLTPAGVMINAMHLAAQKRIATLNCSSGSWQSARRSYGCLQFAWLLLYPDLESLIGLVGPPIAAHGHNEEENL